MSTNDIPVSTVYEQPLTTQPFAPDSILVDDTVALVDDTAALSGAQTTIVEVLKSKVEDPRVFTIIPRSS